MTETKLLFAEKLATLSQEIETLELEKKLAMAKLTKRLLEKRKSFRELVDCWHNGSLNDYFFEEDE
jgi:hypothetical protein